MVDNDRLFSCETNKTLPTTIYPSLLSFIATKKIMGFLICLLLNYSSFLPHKSLFWMSQNDPTHKLSQFPFIKKEKGESPLVGQSIIFMTTAV
jgi:hypothetical protein